MGENNVTELDFDELDRAVNSLISSSPTPLKPDEDAEKTLTLTESSPVATTNPVVAVTPVVPSQPLAAKRSSGRFMDVVHPSSDMRLSTPVTVPAARIGATITPVATPAVTPSPAPEPVVAESVPEVVPIPTIVGSDWPDPLDFNASKTTETDAQEAEATHNSVVTEVDTNDDDDDINEIADAIDDSIKNNTEKAQTSPFIADAKVEKRPLGAFSDEVPVAVAAEVVSEQIEATPAAPVVKISEEATVAAVTTSVTPTEIVPEPPVEGDDSQGPVSVEQPLPEELQNDVLSIESDPVGGDGTNLTLSSTTSGTEEVPVGPTAITQQYKEEPTTGDKQSGAIFDTKSYHKALKQPAKKKSGVVSWILWILVLLALGVGLGAGVYYFVIPLLT